MSQVVVIGGGAAGFFAALAAKAICPQQHVTILEKHNQLLAKVKISGGGRCNVTHSCFEPALLVKNYPRGSKELLGPFQRFQPRDTIAWFEERGVALKTESDGRIFPQSNSSSSIINCLMQEASSLGVEIRTQVKIEEVEKVSSGFEICLKEGQRLSAHKLILATGSSREGFEWARKLGHTIQNPIPSLFAFNIPNSPLVSLSGVATVAEVKLLGTKLTMKAPLLITHAGFSGPAILKLSAFGAHHLHQQNYKQEIAINWLPESTLEDTTRMLLDAKKTQGQKSLSSCQLFPLPKKLWRTLCGEECRLLELSDKKLRALAQKLHHDIYAMDGKTTNKEEFVTCGGITLSEVDFKTMQSKKCPGLFFAGEILDIDGITGGFNFQNAWTTAYLAGNHLPI